MDTARAAFILRLIPPSIPVVVYTETLHGLVLDAPRSQTPDNTTQRSF
jgi:hypothetical protein